MKAGNSLLYTDQAYFTGYQESLLVSVRTPHYLAFFGMFGSQLSAENLCFHNKRKMVIVRGEFCGKQSHEIGP